MRRLAPGPFCSFGLRRTDDRLNGGAERCITVGAGRLAALACRRWLDDRERLMLMGW